MTRYWQARLTCEPFRKRTHNQRIGSCPEASRLAAWRAPHFLENARRQGWATACQVHAVVLHMIGSRRENISPQCS